MARSRKMYTMNYIKRAIHLWNYHLISMFHNPWNTFFIFFLFSMTTTTICVLYSGHILCMFAYVCMYVCMYGCVYLRGRLRLKERERERRASTCRLILQIPTVLKTAMAMGHSEAMGRNHSSCLPSGWQEPSYLFQHHCLSMSALSRSYDQEWSWVSNTSLVMWNASILNSFLTGRLTACSLLMVLSHTLDCLIWHVLWIW